MKISQAHFCGQYFQHILLAHLRTHLQKSFGLHKFNTISTVFCLNMTRFCLHVVIYSNVQILTNVQEYKKANNKEHYHLFSERANKEMAPFQGFGIQFYREVWGKGSELTTNLQFLS